MGKRYSYYSLPPWLRKLRAIAAQFSIPFCVFQAIRTIFIPTVLDVLLLIIFVSVTVAIYLEII
jgi:hypothetical protein